MARKGGAGRRVAEDKRKRRVSRKEKASRKDSLPDYKKVLFKPVVDASKHSREFANTLKKKFVPAVQMMEKCFQSYEDKDGNFVEQFQTTGFDSRIWELYLNTYFLKSGFGIDSSHPMPDFCISKDGIKICVEAVTTNRSLSGPLAAYQEFENLTDRMSFVAIKMGSSLWSKHQKKYWEREHVSGIPLVFAIECFHEDGPFYSGDSPLIDYLYGKSFSWFFDDNNKLVVRNHDEEMVSIKDKEIPSGYFNLEGSENISAVMFSNSATVSKFNRLGKLRWPSYRHRMIRVGLRYHHNDNSVAPLPFEYEVGSEGFGVPRESWGQGLIMFHNPNALNPVDVSLFPDIPHGHFKDGNFVVENMPAFHPMFSTTRIIL